MAGRSQTAKVWRSEANHQWYWHIKARNGRIIAASEGYKRKSDALQGLESLVSNIMAYGRPDITVEEPKPKPKLVLPPLPLV